MIWSASGADPFTGTAAHFGYVPLALFGALAASIAPERSSLSEAARRWCAEDERLLRTQLHTELRRRNAG
jgi:hypothetical protein